MDNKLLLLILPFLLGSCIKEKYHGCPPAYYVEVTVGEKNYANIGSIPGMAPLDEGLPFGSFVHNFYWILEDLNTGQLVASSGENIPAGNGLSFPIDFSGQPSGSYVFTAFGNVEGNPFQATNSSYTNIPLHSEMTEGTDIYRVVDTLEFSSRYSTRQLPMLRTKGALFIQIDNLPDSVSKIVQQIYSVYQNLSADGTYQTETDVTKTFTSGLHPEASLFTLLAPSVVGKQSVIRLALYSGQSESPFRYLPDISFTLKRNEISSFRITFKPEGGVEVWIYADGGWVEYHEVSLN